MRYLIDTNVFLRLYSPEYGELADDVKADLVDCENLLYISSESIREIALLVEIGKINIAKWRTYKGLKSSLDEHGVEIRYVNEAHFKTLFKLRRTDDHHDPSDLVIVAQAIAEKITLVSTDTKFPDYIGQGLDFIPAQRRRRRK